MKRGLWGAGWLALVGLGTAVHAQHMQGGGDSTDAPAPVIMPDEPGRDSSGQAMPLQLPLVDDRRVYDDVLVRIFPSGTVEINRQSLLDIIEPLLRTEARRALESDLPATPFVSFEQVAATGITLRYDASRLEIVIERIEPSLRETQLLGFATASEVSITSQPERFSTYLNLSADITSVDFNTVETPALLAFGAARYDDFVFEFDGGYDKNLVNGSGLYRRQARVVFDEYDKFRRWSAGDLQLSGLPIVAGTLVGGIAVEKGRRVFNAVTPLTSLGAQQFLLDRDATLEVLIDGQQVQTLQLNAGAYDLGQLRAQYAGTNAQLFITDITGRRQITDFDTYVDTIDLSAGEDEYTAALGFIARDFQAGPKYGRDPAFSGFYRRGLTNRLIVGGSLQLSKDVQVGAGEVVVAPKSIPGRFEFSLAASTGELTGYAVRGGYSLQTGSGWSGSQISVSADYRSANFATLADALAATDRREALNVNASYIRYLTERTSVMFGVNWFDRAGSRNNRTVFADVVHRADRFRVTGGVEYGSGPFAHAFGVRVGLTVPFGSRSRADASYNSRRETFRAFASQGLEDRVGSFGYNVGVSRSPGNATVDGAFDYNSNRFNSRFVVTTAGKGFSHVDDRQQARLQVGTSIAYAGGDVAIGRPISDSFVIAKPHESISDQQVVLGRSLRDQRYEALSGAFGPALASRLQSFTRQTVVYDLRDGPAGYDIGSGIETLMPPYRSGYHLVVGSDAMVSSYGFLTLDGKPASLRSGTISSTDDSEFQTQPFFTNSVGRFAIIGLRPGKSYQVKLLESDATFTISVPADAQALQQLGEISLSTGEQGN